MTEFTFAPPLAGGRVRAIAIVFACTSLVGVAICCASLVSAIMLTVLASMLARRREASAVLVFLVLVLAGCAETVDSPAPKPERQASLPNFRARRADGEITPLPSRFAGVVSKDSDLVLSYREQSTQRYEGIPDGIALYITGIFHLLGVPLGSNEVRVTSELTLSDARRTPYRLRAEATALSTYGFYYGAKMSELDQEARRNVRAAVDQLVGDDLVRWLRESAALTSSTENESKAK